MVDDRGAAANGNNLARDNRDKVSNELSPQSREQIQARATKWFEEHQ